MKRIISIVLASAMTATCVACLSGCGGGASADSADAGEVNVQLGRVHFKRRR